MWIHFGNKKYVLCNMYLPIAVAFHITKRVAIYNIILLES